MISESESLLMKFYESNWPAIIGTNGSRNLILILMKMIEQEFIIVIAKTLTLSLKTFTSVRCCFAYFEKKIAENFLYPFVDRLSLSPNVL